MKIISMDKNVSVSYVTNLLILFIYSYKSHVEIYILSYMAWVRKDGEPFLDEKHRLFSSYLEMLSGRKRILIA